MEKYFNYTWQVKVCKETKRAKESMPMFSNLLISGGCTGDLGRCSETALGQIDLLHFCSPEPLSRWYTLRKMSRILHKTAEWKPAGGGVRPVPREPGKKGQRLRLLSDGCTTGRDSKGQMNGKRCAALGGFFMLALCLLLNFVADSSPQKCVCV